MKKLTIAGLGSGDPMDLSMKCVAALEDARVLLVRTGRDRTGEMLKEMGIEYIALDDIYEQAADFDELNAHIAEKVLEYLQKYGSIVYAVLGTGYTNDDTVSLLLTQCEGQSDIEIDMIPGVSAWTNGHAHLLTRAPELARGAYCELCASNIRTLHINKEIPLIVTQMDNQLEASQVKLALSEVYGDEKICLFSTPSGVSEHPLYELDRLKDFSGDACVYIEPSAKEEGRRELEEFVEIIDRLRGPGGCPWDMEQTHESLKMSLIEECYEVLDAIDKNDMAALCEELGDVLLQIAMHARMAKERGDFDIYDVIAGISEKMIYRHPHIFGNISVSSSEEVLQNWEELKKKEKQLQTGTEILNSVPKGFPALLYAYKVASKANKNKLVPEAFKQLDEKLTSALNDLLKAPKNEESLTKPMAELLFQLSCFAAVNHLQGETLLAQRAGEFVTAFAQAEKERIKP